MRVPSRSLCTGGFPGAELNKNFDEKGEEVDKSRKANGLAISSARSLSFDYIGVGRPANGNTKRPR